MATVSAMTSEVKKLSFAKVAAAGSKDIMSTHTVPRAPAITSPRDRRDPKLATLDHFPAARAVTKRDGDILDRSGPALAATVTSATLNLEAKPVEKMTEELRELKMGITTPSLTVNGSGSTSTDRSSKTGNSQTASDNVSQKADSSSELGTKPPSLDGKSITSGTTFNALDEKESLRPDDSASVKAAAEDDDAFSVRGSLLANSRMGSDVAPRIHRIQLGDMPPRTITSHVLQEPTGHEVITPQSSSSEQQVVSDAAIPLLGATSSPDAFNGLYRQNPDEKLLEAMQIPKDRLFLLRLEKDVIDFVQHSKEPYMDLPPCNSFCRMLTHKLADYYHMTHSFEAGAVRIFRTPFCRVPPSLATIASTTASSSNTPPPAILPKKIMRRGEDGEMAAMSSTPSKTTSEAGSDGKDKNGLGKEKLSREEREEAYIKARERIFGSSVVTETSTPENDDGTGVSRASSVSAKDKANQAKRGKGPKQRRADSESFDSRSQYTAYYAHPHQPSWMPPQYVPVGNQYAGQLQQTYPVPMQPPYPPSNQTYQPVVSNTGYGSPYNAVQNYPPQQAQPRYQPPAPKMSSYGSSMQGSPQQTWQATFSQPPYQSRGSTPSVGIPYAYGQLPVNVNPNDPKSQHPIPGSYMRHPFNPKTQSFVPSSGMPPVQQLGPSFNGPAPHAGSGPPGGSSPLGYSSYPQPIGQAPYAGPGGGFGMTRQGSNNSLAPYHHHHIPQQPLQHGAPLGAPPGPQHLLQNPSALIPNKPMSQGPGQTFSHLPNYGNPATLPQKPTI